MKALTLAAAVTALISSASVFAADAHPSSDNVQQTAMMVADSSAPNMQSVSPAGKTRAEVYQELLRAEKSGELQRLNSTLYSN